MASDEDTVTVEVYDGYHESLPARDPDWSAAVEVYDGDYTRQPRGPPPEADTATLSDEISYHSGPIDLHVATDEAVCLFVHTNDSYHNPEDWSRSVEGGLLYGPDISERKPFGCEVWGRVVMWVAERERGA